MRAFLLAFAIAVPLFGQEPPLSPKRAWETLPTGWRNWEKREKRILEFLKRWDASEQEAQGEELYYLGKFYRSGKRLFAARDASRSVAFDETVDEDLRAQAGVDFCSMAWLVARRLDDREAVRNMIDMNEILFLLVKEKRKKQASRARTSLALFYQYRGLIDSAVNTWMLAAREDPTYARSALSAVLEMRLYPSVDTAACLRVRERCLEAHTELVSLYEQFVKRQRETKDESLGSSIKQLAKMKTQRRRIDVFGRPAPDWTLEHAFGEIRSLKQLRGKVVLLYFWTTRRVYELPALRQLLREYQLRPFTVVGVTVTQDWVRDSNYWWDADMRNKAGKQYKPKWLSRKRGLAAELVHRAREIEVIKTFLKNHEVSWPNVMIEKGEPASKYGFTQWPHTVILDKRGRVRGTRHGFVFTESGSPGDSKRTRELIQQLVNERG